MIGDASDQTVIERAIANYLEKLKRMEFRAREEIEQIFNYRHLSREESALTILSEDLFSEHTWKLFGLTREQLVTTGIIGGAASGGLVDVGTGGLTMFLGSGIGAIVGGASAWFGSKQLVGTRIIGLPMGDNEIIVGPVNNKNFPWVLLGRAVTHLRHICERTHAQRGQLTIDHNKQNNLVAALSITDKKVMESIFSRARKGDEIASGKKSQFGKIISTSLVQRPGS